MYKNQKVASHSIVASCNSRIALMFENKILNLKLMIAKRKDTTITADERIQIKEWQKEADYYREEQRRHTLIGRVCGNEFVYG